MSHGNPGSDVALRRAARFFGDRGICADYERRGDHLVQLGEVIQFLVNKVPGLSADRVTQLFLFSAHNGEFGWHGPRRTIRDLLDLDSYGTAPRGIYSLRPPYWRVEHRPTIMRARRSIWARWLQQQEWPVPPGFKVPTFIERAPSPPCSSLIADGEAGPQKKVTGPKPTKCPAVTEAMLSDLRSGKRSPDSLAAEKLESLLASYGSPHEVKSLDTITKARKAAISEFSAIK